MNSMNTQNYFQPKTESNYDDTICITSESVSKPKEELKIEDIISFISYSLSGIINKNKLQNKKQTGGSKEPLYGKKIPNLSIEKFLIRIMKYTEAEKNTLILAYVYIERLIEKGTFILGKNNIYRVLLTATVLAIKFLEDIKYNNNDYCQIGGLTVQEFNDCEFSFFIKLGCNLNATKEDIDTIYEHIIISLGKISLISYNEETISIHSYSEKELKDKSNEEDEKGKK